MHRMINFPGEKVKSSTDLSSPDAGTDVQKSVVRFIRDEGKHFTAQRFE